MHGKKLIIIKSASVLSIPLVQTPYQVWSTKYGVPGLESTLCAGYRIYHMAQNFMTRVMQRNF